MNTNEIEKTIKLTQYSHGAGCGCKISPAVLKTMLEDQEVRLRNFPNLLVGNENNDDAAVMDLEDGTGIISTTDFFMPIVDDPITFGRIAATNAISDIYAMGGTPIMAIAIFGWPIDKLSPEIGKLVLRGGRIACQEAGIPIAGGHSIDAPEPIFGLAVTGRIPLNQLKRNNTAKAGDLLFLSKPLGIGILTTAQKSGILKKEDELLSINLMCKLNKIGIELSRIPGVSALTDVTGFGLGGHLLELCNGSNLKAIINKNKIPVIKDLNFYIKNKQIPGGTNRNFLSYGENIGEMDEKLKAIICDPQTSGGLLISVQEKYAEKVRKILKSDDCYSENIGVLTEKNNDFITIEFQG